MARLLLVYGAGGGLLIALLKVVEYRVLVVEHSLEIYGGVVAVLFAAIGIRLGRTLTRTQQVVVVRKVPVPVASFVRDDARIAELGITPRELEVLEHIARGMSTRDIAGALFVSENTVKTHASRLFDKLGVNRRTQAVHVGKSLRLIA